MLILNGINFPFLGDQSRGCLSSASPAIPSNAPQMGRSDPFSDLKRSWATPSGTFLKCPGGVGKASKKELDWVYISHLLAPNRGSVH